MNIYDNWTVTLVCIAGGAWIVFGLSVAAKLGYMVLTGDWNVDCS